MVAPKIAAIGLFLAVAVYGGENPVEDRGPGARPRYIWNGDRHNPPCDPDTPTHPHKKEGVVCGPLQRPHHELKPEGKILERALRRSCCKMTNLANDKLVCGKDSPDTTSTPFTCQRDPKVGRAAHPKNVHFPAPAKN